MADIGFLRQRAKSIPDDTTRRAVLDIVETLATQTSLGAPDHQKKATNFQAFYLEGTTSTTADQEFSMVHGLKRTPVVVLQVLNPQSVDARMVRLKTTRAADTNRIYLSSPDAGAAITVLVE